MPRKHRPASGTVLGCEVAIASAAAPQVAQEVTCRGRRAGIQCGRVHRVVPSAGSATTARRERYAANNDAWYQSMIAAAQSSAQLAETARRASVLGRDTRPPPSSRTWARFLDFVGESITRSPEAGLQDPLYEGRNNVGRYFRDRRLGRYALVGLTIRVEFNPRLKAEVLAIPRGGISNGLEFVRVQRAMRPDREGDRLRIDRPPHRSDELGIHECHPDRRLPRSRHHTLRVDHPA